MFVVDVTERGGETTRLVFHKPEVTIGRVEGNDIVLPNGSVSKRHARFVCKDGKYIAVDLKSTNGTYVDGRRLTSPLVIREGSLVYVGDYKLVIQSPHEAFEEDQDTRPVCATELRLLASITQREDGSRMVYADWLEEQGDATRAEFLRVQERIAGRPAEDPVFQVASRRLRILAGQIDVNWRYKIARPLVENCLRFDLECPKEWGSLALTEDPRVRHCDACSQRVTYCSSIDEARAHTGAGGCVAVDIAQLRRPDDLKPRRMMMGMVVPERG